MQDSLAGATAPQVRQQQRLGLGRLSFEGMTKLPTPNFPDLFASHKILRGIGLSFFSFFGSQGFRFLVDSRTHLRKNIFMCCFDQFGRHLKASWLDFSPIPRRTF